MRLTLRTMLAYMDDILEPADHQDVGQKIEESEFATNLLHRIRDVTRQMRMAAPKVSGRGMGLDPNTVAEYLDNVLSGERVPDFEKVCLESNVHLAEVAACHQILSLVLGEPAEVDPELRRRMYEIAARSQEAGLSDSDEADGLAAPPRSDIEPPAIGAAVGAGAADDGHAAAGRARLEVPEYLRSQRRSRFWPASIAVILAICLLAAIDLAMFGWDNNPTLKWLPGWKPAANVANSENSGKSPDNSAKNRDNSGKNRPNANGGSAPAENVGTVNGETNPAKPEVVEPGTNPNSPNAAGTGTPVPSVPPIPPGPPSVSPSPPLPSPPLPASAGTPAAGNAIGGNAVVPAGGPPGAAPGTAPGALPSQVPPLPPAAAGGVHAGAIPNPFKTGEIGIAPPVAPGAAPPGAAPAGNAPPGVGAIPPAANSGQAKTGAFGPAAVRLGRMVSDQELLLRLPAGQGEWQRVGPGVTLGLKDRLLAPPTFRPTIALSAGVTVQLMPETVIDLEGYDPAGLPMLRVEYGRVVMATAGKPDVRVRLILGDTAGTLTFFDPEATAAIQVRHMLVAGSDPQTGLPKLVVALYSTVGQIDWTSSAGAAGESRGSAPGNQPPALPNGGKLTAPARLVLAGSSADVPGSAHELPRWVVSDPINPLDTRASQVMNETLDSKTSISVGLKELVEHRRAENRSLAARCMALIDEFDPFASLLNDPDQRAVWPVEIESLQSALARGPSTAGKVRAMFERERGKEGDDLYRLLWGYTKDQLQSGAAPTLVDDLDNDSLDFRVLSFYNLQKIAGKTFDYRPEASAANRAQPVRRWREQLREGLIVPKGSPPSKAQAAAAKSAETPGESDASRGLEPPVKPIPPNPNPPKLPPPPVPGQD